MCHNHCLNSFILHPMEIISAKYIISSPDYKQSPGQDLPEYAFIGRSNVGKSSLINMISNNKNLAKTSGTPGKTQLINHFEIISTHPAPHSGEGKRVRWSIVDLPGYGYAKRSQTSRRRWEQMIENYIRKRENLVCLFVLIDSRHEPQQIDLDFINQLGKWGIPFVLVFTKADKNKPAATRRNVESFLKALSENWEQPPPHFVTSAISKEGRKLLLDYIGSLNSSFTKL
jgi:GTP-binding protein